MIILEDHDVMNKALLYYLKEQGLKSGCVDIQSLQTKFYGSCEYCPDQASLQRFINMYFHFVAEWWQKRKEKKNLFFEILNILHI